MQNYSITRGLGKNIVVPELYYLETKGGTISFIFTDRGWKAISVSREKIRKDLQHLLPSESKSWGIHEILPCVQKKNDTLIFAIDVSLQIDDEKRRDVCESLAGFLWLMGTCFSEVKEERDVREKEQLQLFSLETYYNRDGGFGAGALSLSVSLPAAKFFRDHPAQAVPNVQKKMREHAKKKFPDHTPAVFSSMMSGYIKESGNLGYTTSGNCACMGVDSDRRVEDEGFYVSSHNVDTSWQQLNLVVGIATTWEWVRTSLGYK